MSVCLVCAEEWKDHDGGCAHCSTQSGDLEQMLGLAGKVRFLFGDTQAQVRQTSNRAAPTKSNLRQKSVAAKVNKQRTLVTVEPIAQSSVDMIRNRDAVIRQETPGQRIVRRRMAAYCLDIVICLFLNYWVVRLILLFSPRTLDDLVTFSLIPVLFVLLSFAFLYYWLFYALFQKTLGSILIDKWRRG